MIKTNVKNISKVLVSLLLSFVLVLTLTRPATAQNGDGGSGFKVTPIRVELEIQRGRSITSNIELENVTQSRLVAVAVVDDFTPGDDESGVPRLLIGENAIEDYPFSIKPFILPIDEVSLGPGEKRNISVTFSAPNTISPGAYYGVVRFVDKAQQADSTVALSASVGTIFLVSVPGDTVEILQLEQISASRNGKTGSIFASPPTSVTIRLKNEGNTFIAPFGRVTVTDWRGNTIYTYEMNSIAPRGNVLPQSIRKYVDEIDSVGRFGRYTIEANISYGTGGSIINAKATFWVIPWVVLTVIVVLLALVIFISTKGIKAYNEMIIRRARGSRR